MNRHLAGTLCLLLAILPAPTRAEPLLAARTLRANTVIDSADLALPEGESPAALSNIVGMETRVTIYAGRPVKLSDLTPPAVIERNQIVPLIYRRGSLSIQAEARALGRGAAGQSIRVMNLDSKATLTAVVDPSGAALVN
jgi:flagella basal body P-ring formation protein FlgA